MDSCLITRVLPPPPYVFSVYLISGLQTNRLFYLFFFFFFEVSSASTTLPTGLLHRFGLPLLLLLRSFFCVYNFVHRFGFHRVYDLGLLNCFGLTSALKQFWVFSSSTSKIILGFNHYKDFSLLDFMQFGRSQKKECWR